MGGSSGEWDAEAKKKVMRKSQNGAGGTETLYACTIVEAREVLS